jgi:hypothetical protein
MRKVWIVPLVSLLVFTVVGFVSQHGLVISIEAAPPSTETPESVNGDDPGGFPLVTQTYLGYNLATAPNAPILLRQAPFVPYDEVDQRLVQGNVQHRLVDSTELLHFTPNFNVETKSTPELILTESSSPTEAEIADSFVLTTLDELAGGQEYEVPAELDFVAVVIYDRVADSVLAIAHLEPEPVCGEIPKRGALALMDPEDAPKTCVAIDDTSDLNRTGTPPTEVDIDDYHLIVEGMVDNPLNLTFEDLRQYPSTSEVVLLICSGFFADNVEWTGVPLSVLLEDAQINPDYKALRLESGSDGYWVNLEKDEFNPEDIIVAYEVNGGDIPLEHGYPVRVAIKDAYGSKWVKWLKRIEVLEE